VVTADGPPEPVTWTGRITALPAQRKGWPVVIPPGLLGNRSALSLSPQHRPRQPVVHVHFSCDRHDLVRANGAWCETLLTGEGILGGDPGRPTSPPRADRPPLKPVAFCRRGAKLPQRTGTIMTDKPSIETRFERGLFASRWLMAPMYLGLVVALAMLSFVFVRELFYYLPQLMQMSAEDTILAALKLIDLTLAANLLLIVLFSGYENFVSKFDFDTGTDRPDWMGKVDFSGLKMKLIASIIAISGIHLLKKFMEIRDIDSAVAFGESEMFWLVVIHLTFVVSGVLMALMDFLAERGGARLGTRKSG
jgi:uncharacterized protein (TIGR00645 family)